MDSWLNKREKKRSMKKVWALTFVFATVGPFQRQCAGSRPAAARHAALRELESRQLPLHLQAGLQCIQPAEASRAIASWPPKPAPSAA